MVASLGELTAEADARWTEAPPDDGILGPITDFFADPPEHSDHCQGPGFADERGCGCSTQKSTPATAGMLLVLLGLATRRRRR